MTRRVTDQQEMIIYISGRKFWPEMIRCHRVVDPDIKVIKCRVEMQGSRPTGATSEEPRIKARAGIRSANGKSIETAFYGTLIGIKVRGVKR